MRPWIAWLILPLGLFFLQCKKEDEEESSKKSSTCSELSDASFLLEGQESGSQNENDECPKVQSQQQPESTQQQVVEDVVAQIEESANQDEQITEQDDESEDEDSPVAPLPPAPLALPPDPAGLTAIPASSTTVDVNWTTGGGTTVDFVVAHSNGGTAPSNCSSGIIASTESQPIEVQFGPEHSFRVCARNGEGGLSEGAVITTTAGAFDNYDFELGDLLAFGDSSSNLPMIADNSVAKEGLFSARSGTVDHNENSCLERDYTTNGSDVRVSWYWRVDSENGWDRGYFYVDNSIKSVVTGSFASVTNDNGFVRGSWELPDDATYTLKWCYAKDSSVSSGEDALWIDDIQFTDIAGPIDNTHMSTVVDSHDAITVSWDDDISAGSVGGHTLKYHIGTAQYYKCTGTPSVSRATLGVGTNHALTTLRGGTTYTFELCSETPSTGGTTGYRSIQATTTDDDGTQNPSFETNTFEGGWWNSSVSSSLFWQIGTSIVQDGTYAAHSTYTGTISTCLTRNVQLAAPATLEFYWKVDSEASDDFFHFKVGSATIFSISGDVDWEQKTHALGTGTHLLQWCYDKGDSTGAGADRAYLDNLTWTP